MALGGVLFGLLFAPPAFANEYANVDVADKKLALQSKSEVNTSINATLLELKNNANQIDNINTHVPLKAISPETLKTFVAVVDLVRRKYAYDVNDENLFRYAMGGMLNRLDSHAEFLDETAFKNLQAFTEGSIAHVGLVVSFDNNKKEWVVEEVLDGSSAKKHGFDVGDYLHQIGDKKLDASLREKDVAQLLSGLAGSQITITSSKAGRSKHNTILQRTSPVNDKLSVRMQNGVAIIRLPIFTDKTRQELNEALARIKDPIQAVVLDVRDNPGGVLSSAIEVASLFVHNENVVKIVERGKAPETLKTTGHAPLVQMPVILVQNRYSASAAEVLALALQNDQETTIMGETSYGKGSIQSIIPLGNNEAVKLTTAHYEGVDNQKIDGVGIKPDIEINFDNEQWFDEVLDLAQGQKLSTGMILYLSDDY